MKTALLGYHWSQNIPVNAMTANVLYLKSSKKIATY